MILLVPRNVFCQSKEWNHGQASLEIISLHLTTEYCLAFPTQDRDRLISANIQSQIGGQKFIDIDLDLKDFIKGLGCCITVGREVHTSGFLVSITTTHWKLEPATQHRQTPSLFFTRKTFIGTT